MCIELTNGSLNYLIPTPNSTNDVGFNRDRFLLNPDLTSTEDLLAFKFIGKNCLVYIELLMINYYVELLN
jgi:E3 ubiquitin-protein ligase HERC1